MYFAKAGWKVAYLLRGRKMSFRYLNFPLMLGLFVTEYSPESRYTLAPTAILPKVWAGVRANHPEIPQPNKNRARTWYWAGGTAATLVRFGLYFRSIYRPENRPFCAKVWDYREHILVVTDEVDDFLDRDKLVFNICSNKGNSFDRPTLELYFGVSHAAYTQRSCPEVRVELYFQLYFSSIFSSILALFSALFELYFPPENRPF